MSTGQIITGARTLWELVERRAEASPDHAMLIDADDRMLTFGAFRDRAADGGRRSARRRGGPGQRGVLAAAHPDRHRCPVGRPEPPRRRAEPDHPPLPGARGGLRPPPDRLAALRRPPGVAGHRLRGAGRAVAGAPGRCPGRTGAAARHLGGRRRAARRRPGLAPAAAEPPSRPRRHRSAGSTTPRAARPTPRGCATPTRPSSPAAGAWPSPSTCRPTTWGRSPSPSPTSPVPTTW